MYKRNPLIFLCCFIYTTFLFPQDDGSEQEFNLPSGFGLANQLEYSYDYKNEQQILENWFNLDYRHTFFSAGVRLVAFQPNDPNPGISRGKEKFTGIDYKYVKAEFGSGAEALHITAGNYHALFSYGMILKSYEDRNIRVDNNLMGVKVDARYAGFNLSLLSGSAETSEAEREDILHAGDLEFRGIKNLRFGLTHAVNIPYIDGIAKTSLSSFRIKPTLGNIDLYVEYGIKQNKEQEILLGQSITGNAFYGSASFYAGPFSLIGEYKYYDNFTFISSDGTIVYNAPPAVRRDFTYSLLNRHPSPLNQSNEQGYQVEANYILSDETTFNSSFSITRTLPASSIYQRLENFNNDVRTQQTEFFFQGAHHWSDKLYTVFAFGFNEELDGNTRNYTPIVEARYYLDEMNTIRLILEHQQTKNLLTEEEYFTELILLEFLHSPWFTVAFVGELQTREPAPGRKIRPTWKFVQTTFKIGNYTDLSVLVGSRQAGNICVGGICRYEPEFNGVELKMLTRF